MCVGHSEKNTLLLLQEISGKVALHKAAMHVYHEKYLLQNILNEAWRSLDINFMLVSKIYKTSQGF